MITFNDPNNPKAISGYIGQENMAKMISDGCFVNDDFLPLQDIKELYNLSEWAKRVRIETDGN